MTPRYLFRVYGAAKSNGMDSTPVLVNPASSVPTTSDSLATALLTQHHSPAANRPFVFFESSLLCALQLANLMREKDARTDVHIACVDTATATVSNGRAVTFLTVGSLTEEYGPQWQGYEDVFVVVGDSIQLGEGSSDVGFEELIGKGLYRLYPDLGQAKERRKMRMHETVAELRRFWFGTGPCPLTEETVGIAAKMAAAFKPVGQERDGAGVVPRHLVLWFLAFKKRLAKDPVLLDWLDRRSGGVDLPSEWGRAGKVGIPEIEQYHALERDVQGREFHSSILTCTAGIGSSGFEKTAARQGQERHSGVDQTERVEQINFCSRTASQGKWQRGGHWPRQGNHANHRSHRWRSERSRSPIRDRQVRGTRSYRRGEKGRGRRLM